jgi:outer membrane protein TolC
MSLFRKVTIMVLFIRVLYAQEDPLENYIKIGLESNLALQQQKFSLAQSITALDEARGMYYPSIDIGARYTRAGGGREIVIPVGDLVNPIYKTLNALLQAQGLEPSFPENIPNQTTPFLREKEHETRARLTQPIFQPAIWSNYGLKSDLKDIELLKTNAYKRHLINEIKRAYYNYMKATMVVELYAKIKDLQEENLRVSKKLFQAGSATQNVVFRAEAELSRTEQEKMNVENLQRQGASYLNFILNRSLESPIDTINQARVQIPLVSDYDTSRESAFQNREELLQIKKAISAAKETEGIVKSKYYPGISAVVDYGFQGEEYRFTEQDDYWMASIVLQWNLFKGFQDKAQLQHAYLETQKLKTKEIEIKNMIELEVERILDNLHVARKSISVAQQQFQSARASFRIVRKKFDEGIASQVEYLDAQTTLTNSAINEVITRYDYYITYAEYERIIAGYNLNNTKLE